MTRPLHARHGDARCIILVITDEPPAYTARIETREVEVLDAQLDRTRLVSRSPFISVHSVSAFDARTFERFASRHEQAFDDGVHDNYMHI